MRGVHAALHTVVPCRHCRHLSAIGVGADHGAKTIKTSPGHSGFSSTGRRVLNIFGNSHWQHSDVSPSYQHIISYNHIPIIYCIYIYFIYHYILIISVLVLDIFIRQSPRPVCDPLPLRGSSSATSWAFTKNVGPDGPGTVCVPYSSKQVIRRT